MSRTAANFAAGVSRALIKQGLRPLPSGTPHGRQGVRVERFLDKTATITVDYRVDRTGWRVAADVELALGIAGYAVDRAPSSMVMHVERAELGTAPRPRKAARLGDTCPQCKAEGELWSSYFTPDGNGGTGVELGARYLTMCQSCATFYDTGAADPQ